MALPLLGGIVVAIKSAFAAGAAIAAGRIAAQTVATLAIKAAIMSAVYIALPIVLYNVFANLLMDPINYTVSQYTGFDTESITIQLSGLGAWLADRTNLPQIMSIYMTAISTRFMIGFIPFHK